MINWKIRVKNKAFWVAFIPALLLAIQAFIAVWGVRVDLGALGNSLLGFVNAVFALLAVMGVVTDPTTTGAHDSAQALKYTRPKQ